MDNIFNILLILFIVYALLSPFLKKKKQQQVPKRQEPHSEEFGEATVSQESQPSQDMLAEIEDLLGIKRERETLPDVKPYEMEIAVDKTSDYQSSEQFQFKTKEQKVDSFKFKSPTIDHFDTRQKIKADFSQPMLDLYDYGKSALPQDSYVVAGKYTEEEQVEKEFDLSFEGYGGLQKGIILKEILDKPRVFRKPSRW
ncbi:MAG: hypothetical protein KJ666_02870 [Bacteroidetes bacterium]|nr:hypothetical protein [Bacteroidota bacterium]